MDYYSVLGVSKKATQPQIKQSYRQLALKYHPDKNVDKQTAKIKFTEISQAYSVLNDPSKRQFYDQYGKTDIDMQQFQQFQTFMEDFGLFETFLDDYLMFDSINEINKMFKKGRKGRAKRTKANNNLEDLLTQALGQSIFGPKKKKQKQQQIEESDDEDLTEEEMKILQFGNQNIQKKKVSKKYRTFCKLDHQKIEQDEILLHFSDKHMKEFKEWSALR